jgi:hypothetical protein
MFDFSENNTKEKAILHFQGWKKFHLRVGQFKNSCAQWQAPREHHHGR